MEEKNIQTQIDEINRKLDVIVEEIELQRRRRMEVEDLKEDLMRVGTDLYQTVIEELEGMSDSFDSKDLAHLGKKLLRNVKTINNAVEQLESIRDFVQDAAPISRDAIIDFMNKLDELDRKGYFEFMKEGGRIIDNVVTSFSPEDARALADNIVTILETVRNLTQPDMLNSLNSAVNVYKNLDIEITGKVSYFTLLKELNTPELKKGFAFVVQFLKNMANEQTNNKNNKKTIIT